MARTTTMKTCNSIIFTGTINIVLLWHALYQYSVPCWTQEPRRMQRTGSQVVWLYTLWYYWLHRRGDNFSPGGAKIGGEKESKQSNSKYNFIQYIFFEKGIYGVQWGLGDSRQKLGVFENFCVTVCKVTFNWWLPKKWGDGPL